MLFFHRKSSRKERDAIAISYVRDSSCALVIVRGPYEASVTRSLFQTLELQQYINNHNTLNIESSVVIRRCQASSVALTHRHFES